MIFAASQREATWLVSDGVTALEVLFRAVLFRRSEPILIADNGPLRPTLRSTITEPIRF